jgi:hypothetical protein
MTIATLSRRTVLRGARGIAIGLPLLDIMVRKGRTPAQEAPRRFVTHFSANGTVPSAWKPTGTGTAFQLSPILQPLSAHRQRLLVIGGLNDSAGLRGVLLSHCGISTMLTGRPLPAGELDCGGAGKAGWPAGHSLDQEIAGKIGATTKFRSLQFGVDSRSTLPLCVTSSFAGVAQPLAPENSPAAMFRRLFSDFAAPATTQDPAAADLEIRRTWTQRRSILDAVHEDFAALDGRVGAADRQKLGVHLEALRSLEKRIAGTTPPTAPVIASSACKKPAAPPDAKADFPTTGRLQTDLLVMALACDLTRVASLQWGVEVDGHRHPWANADVNHHDASHKPDGDAAAQTALININTWYAKQFAYLLDQMQANGLIDRSLVWWFSGISIGNTHSSKDHPTVLAGDAGRYFKTGRYLTFPGNAVNDLHVSILNAMGVAATTFGLPEVCKGPLPGLTG